MTPPPAESTSRRSAPPRRAGPKIVRTACYCRVSTALETQQLSLSSQIEGFTRKISETPGMVLAGIYADEGITGTSARRRTQFLRMIRDAEDGKIDCIMTKSISRFARNTVECLQYVRRLREQGIRVIFEKEAIDTSTAMSEMLLTVLAAFAQEESRSISENLKWGIRKRYEMGEARWSPVYGYRRGTAGAFVPEPAEAETVRAVFEAYRTGASAVDIVQDLNRRGVPSPRGARWSTTTLTGILRNEKYAGDLRLQKWITTDHITHRTVPNDGAEVPVYYLRDHHEGIVPRRTFTQVQRILELKAPRGEIIRYPYADTEVLCPLCGARMVARQMHVQAQKKAICCFGEDGCRRFSAKAHLLDRAVYEAFTRLPDISGAGEAACRMRALRAAGAAEAAERMEYHFLADAVARVSFSPAPGAGKTPLAWQVTVRWQNGQSSSVPFPAGPDENPLHVADLYRRYLDRITSGAYVPARPTCSRERILREEGRVKAP